MLHVCQPFLLHWPLGCLLSLGFGCCLSAWKGLVQFTTMHCELSLGFSFHSARPEGAARDACLWRLTALPKRALFYFGDLHSLQDFSKVEGFSLTCSLSLKRYLQAPSSFPHIIDDILQISEIQINTAIAIKNTGLALSLPFWEKKKLLWERKKKTSLPQSLPLWPSLFCH